MNNKTIGNSFEQRLCDKLSEHGFWSHCMAMNKAGQPADIIAVKNKKAYLIDAKVCTNDTFPLSRVEENQDLAMELWSDCGNDTGWFALELGDEVYMLAHSLIRTYMMVICKKSISGDEIRQVGTPLETWVKQCK